MTSSSSPSPERILQLAWGYAPPLILETALHGKVFDLIDQAPRTVKEVAAHANGSERGWRMILNALVSLGFLKKEEDRYHTTPESSTFLVTTKPGFVGGLLKHTSTQLIPRWLNIHEAVRTGKAVTNVSDSDEGQKFFANFVNDIFNMSYPSAVTLATHLKIATRSEARVLDLGTGSGVWGIAFAQQSPQVRVTAVDWPNVLDITRGTTARFNVGPQFDYIAGDLLQVEYPKDQDVVTIGHILHSEGETRSRALLKRTAAALKPGGTVAIAEFTPNADRSGPPIAMLFAVNMLVNTDHGDTYPFHEVEAWLKDAGFTNVRELPCPGPAPLILADKQTKAA